MTQTSTYYVGIDVAKVRNGDQNLVAMGTGTFRIFEKRGNPIV